MAATSTFNSTSQMFLLFIFDVFVKFVTFVNSLLFEDCAAFLPCHCTDETRPVLFREPLKASEACPEADVPDVTLCVVFAWRCPAADDVTDAIGLVLVAVGSEDAEGSTKSPFDEGKLAESSPPPDLPPRREGLGSFTFPECLASANVPLIPQRLI